MSYGHFDDKRREYVITNPQTPWPWINYLGSEDFFGLISNTAGGYDFYKDAKFRRITRYRYNGVPMDDGGRYFYIKDEDCIWNPGWKPCKTHLDRYECRHGLNYTIISGSKKGVDAEVLFFVPLKTHAEIQKVKLTNNTPFCKKLKLFSFVEWCLWNASTDMENFQRNFSTGEVEIEGSVIYHKTEYVFTMDLMNLKLLLLVNQVCQLLTDGPQLLHITLKLTSNQVNQKNMYLFLDMSKML